MHIAGLQKMTLLDFPNRVAATVFLPGCNFRCPFCHNSPLLRGIDELSEDAFFAYLKKRQGLLDGVAVTGGEPLLQPDLGEFLEKIKELGFGVKLDTNGSQPQHLEKLLQKGLIDYIAMDIKNSPAKYERTAGATGILPQVQESVELIRSCGVDYEFRTTVVAEFHEAEDFHAIGQWLRGANAYYIQCFEDSGDILCPGLHAPDLSELEQYLAIAGSYIPNTHLRGI